MELVEEKDKQAEGIHDTPEFEEETRPKIATIFLRVTKSMWGSGRGCVLDSGFGNMLTVAELRKKYVHITTVIKRRDFDQNTQMTKKR